MTTRFLLGDKVFLTKKDNIMKECNICDGTGELTIRTESEVLSLVVQEEKFTCPKCHGKGEIFSEKKYVVVDEEQEVEEINIKVKKDGTAYRYKLRSNDGKRIGREESNIFASREDAQCHCDLMNDPIRMVNINDIKVRQIFLDSTPSLIKINKHMDTFNETGELDIIQVNSDMLLVDGYISYKLAKLLDITEVKVEIVQ